MDEAECIVDETERINGILGELGALFDPAAIIHDPDEDTWSIAMDAEATISLALDSGESRLQIAVPVGAAPKGGAQQVYEAMLRFNFLWRDQGGMYVSLDADGRAYLMFREPLSDLDARRLNGLLQGLVDKAADWRDLFETDPISADSGGEGGVGPSGPLRV